MKDVYRVDCVCLIGYRDVKVVMDERGGGGVGCKGMVLCVDNFMVGGV